MPSTNAVTPWEAPSQAINGSDPGPPLHRAAQESDMGFAPLRGEPMHL